MHGLDLHTPVPLAKRVDKTAGQFRADRPGLLELFDTCNRETLDVLELQLFWPSPFPPS